MKSENRGEIIIYKEPRGKAAIDVKLQEETVWLSQDQMTRLFDKNKRTISEHIRNVFKEKELHEKSVVRKFRTTARDGKSYEVTYYNLDVIISVGYRVKSKNGTQFRIWATRVLREHLVKGFTVNERRLKELHQAAHLLYFLVKNHSFVDGNKRIAAALFLWFLEKNRFLYWRDGTKRIADNALVAMCLLIAESRPAEKEILVQVVANLINKKNM